jgi:hypothetical protein
LAHAFRSTSEESPAAVSRRDIPDIPEVIKGAQGKWRELVRSVPAVPSHFDELYDLACGGAMVRYHVKGDKVSEELAILLADKLSLPDSHRHGSPCLVRPPDDGICVGPHLLRCYPALLYLRLKRPFIHRSLVFATPNDFIQLGTSTDPLRTEDVQFEGEVTRMVKAATSRTISMFGKLKMYQAEGTTFFLTSAGLLLPGFIESLTRLEQIIAVEAEEMNQQPQHRCL